MLFDGAWLKEFDERKHPRAPAGSEAGGEFVSAEAMPVAAPPGDKTAEVYKWHYSPETVRRVLGLRTAPTKWGIDVASKMKSHVMRTIAKDIEFPSKANGGKLSKTDTEEIVNETVAGWAGSSTNNRASQYLQVAAMQLTGFKPKYWAEKEKVLKKSDYGGVFTRRSGDAKIMAKAIYNKTQQFLKNGPEYLTLYRGMGGVQTGKIGRAKEIDLTTNPLSSWTSDRAIASGFANFHPGGRVVSIRVHRSRVFSTAFTGPGCLSEKEYIVFGRKGDRARVVK